MSGEEERPWTVVSLSRGQKRRSKRTAMKKQLYATDPGANNNNSNHNNYQSTDDYDDNNNNNYNYSDNKYNTTPTSGTTTSSTIGSDTKEKEEKRMRLRKNVLEEIVNTEIAYIDSLYTLMIYYITPLRNSERFPELSSSPKGDVKMLFSTVELIFDSNNELLTSLREEMSNSHKPEPMLGEVFLHNTEKLAQFYGVFCNHQKEAMDCIEQAMKTSPAFKSFVESCMQKPETKGLSLLDYLVKPFQRLLKYPLLLSELLKYTPTTHPDYENLTRALEKLQGEVDVINKNKARNDNLKTMLEINKAMEGLPRGFKLLIPSRVPIYQGTLRKISGSHDQERHVILFNDCLLYAKKKSDGKYLCRGIIYLNKLSVEDMTDSVSFKVHRRDKNLTYILYGKTKKEKEIWLHEIKSQQQKLNPSSVSSTNSTTNTTEQQQQPGLKRDVVRVYISKETFKTFAVTSETTVKELCEDCARKIKIDGKSPEDYKLCTYINGQERLLQPTEKPFEVQQTLIKQGVKFGNENNHFKLSLPSPEQISLLQQQSTSNNNRKNTSSNTYFTLRKTPAHNTSNNDNITTTTTDTNGMYSNNNNDDNNTMTSTNNNTNNIKPTAPIRPTNNTQNSSNHNNYNNNNTINRNPPQYHTTRPALQSSSNNNTTTTTTTTNTPSVNGIANGNTTNTTTTTTSSTSSTLKPPPPPRPGGGTLRSPYNSTSNNNNNSNTNSNNTSHNNSNNNTIRRTPPSNPQLQQTRSGIRSPPPSRINSTPTTTTTSYPNTSNNTNTATTNRPSGSTGMGSGRPKPPPPTTTTTTTTTTRGPPATLRPSTNNNNNNRMGGATGGGGGRGGGRGQSFPPAPPPSRGRPIPQRWPPQ